ncbi:hypothetical protein JW962_03220 [Candidatus Dojkabacteria bacterium]|nr:hypothetical protein [Candidatus Dojkabacteria bacterium]
MVNPNSDQQTSATMPTTSSPMQAPVSGNPSGNDLSQKLLLLIRNAGAPQMVKDSLVTEVENKGPNAEVMDKIIQAFQTEKDILNLTINSIENLKKQVSVQQPLVAAPVEPVTSPVPEPVSVIPPPAPIEPQPVVENPIPEVESTLPVPAPPTVSSEPAATPVPNTADSDQELTNLLDELKQIQGQQQGDQANPAPVA